MPFAHHDFWTSFSERMEAMLESRERRILRALRRLALIAAFLSASTISPQQSPSPQSSTTPALRATTHLVLVDVVVYDKQGNHVTNLTSADFILRDRGKPQKIAVFSNDRAGESVTEKSPAPSPAPLPPGVFTNRPAFNRAPQGPPTILLLDSLNTALSDQLSS